MSRVEAIYLAPGRGEPRVRVERVRAVEGKGLEGDRYFGHVRRPGGKHDPERQVTLVEAEALEAARAEAGRGIRPAESRRNVVTRGVRLNDLVGREFRVGGALLRGVELCEPCVRLARFTYREVVHDLKGRGGLRAAIVRGGEIREGDPVEAEELRLAI